MAERANKVPLWARVAFPLAVLGVALGVGSGVFDSAAPTASQEAAAIEAGIRCPSCTDLSVAQSNATTAIAVRRQIEQLVAQGRSPAEIDQVLVSEYGQTILLVPPDSGGIPLIWVIPLALGAVALCAVGIVFWRRSRDFDALKAAAPGNRPPDQAVGARSVDARHGPGAEPGP